MPLPLDELKPYTATCRHQLTVVAASMADVVQSAGGWLCDRARAGWDVSVLVTGDGDGRALAILGATARAADEDICAVVAAVAPTGPIAVSARLLGSDDRLRESVGALVKRGFRDVTVFGEQWPTHFRGTIGPVEHRLSSAARAFKAHALDAAGGSRRAVADTETLFCLGRGSVRPLHSA